MRVHTVVENCLIIALLMMIAGCPAPAKMVDANNLASVEREIVKPITYTDKESLQSGTGVVDDDASMEFLETDSGLKYRVLRASSGRKPTASNTVTVNYRGWLDNGREFDSSYKRGEPISFPLDGVIPGWTEGMQLVGEGGMIELWVPSALGYGTKGSPGSIPPNATLHFIVELIQVR
jgi:FKBP-type peptidyl-prolyl cis-trans isomerase FkpA